MKFINILLLNLLFLNAYCIYIIGKDEEITITDVLKTGIIFIKLNNFSNAEKVYVKLEMDNGYIDDYINVKFSNSTTIGISNFTRYEYYSKVTSLNIQTNYYRIYYQKYNYMILKYSLNTFWSNPNYLKVKAKDKDPTTKTTIIIFIVAGSVTLIGLTITIGVLIYQRNKKQKKDMKTNEVPNEISPNSYASSQESFVNNNKINDDSNNKNNSQQYYPEYPQPY